MTKKKYFLPILWIVAIFILLFGCLILKSRAQWNRQFEGEAVFKEEAGERRCIYEGISLSSGVYELQLSYHTTKDYSARFYVEGDVKHLRLLRTNGEHAYVGLETTNFTLWLLEPTQNLRVYAEYTGEGELTTSNLNIHNTGKLWTMLFVVLAAGVTVLFFAGFLAKKIWQAKETGLSDVKKSILTGLALLAITALASYSQLGESMLGGADLTYHLMRIEGVKDSLLSGQFPIRIEPNWLYGHGYANGIFYCDALLYLPALLRLAGFPINLAYNFYCICLNFACAWIAWFCFGRIFKDNKIGLMCSALYTLSIIRLYKLAIVGAVGEGSAITFLPLIFYGMYLVFTEKERQEGFCNAWIYLALGYAGLMQTHVLTCEITAFLTLLVCLIGIKRIFQKSVFIELAKGALGAIGLSFWYLVPFLDYFLTQDMQIRHVSGRTIQYRGLYLGQLFVNSWSVKTMEKLSETMPDTDPVGVGILLMCALIFFCMLWLSGRFLKAKEGEPGRDILKISKISALLACLLLAMTLRQFPWDFVQSLSPVSASLVSSLQFPNRFLGWAVVFLIMLFGTCLWRFCKYKWTYYLGAALTIFSLCTCSLYMMHDALKEQNHLYLYNEAGMGFGYISGAEYLVYGTRQEELTFSDPAPSDEVQLTAYEKRSLGARFTCENTSDQTGYVDLPLLLYKGYGAKTDTGEPLALVPSDNHLVRVEIPAAFAGEVTVKFTSPIYWRIAELVTLVALGTLLLSRRVSPCHAECPFVRFSETAQKEG